MVFHFLLSNPGRRALARRCPGFPSFAPLLPQFFSSRRVAVFSIASLRSFLRRVSPCSCRRYPATAVRLPAPPSSLSLSLLQRGSSPFFFCFASRRLNLLISLFPLFLFLVLGVPGTGETPLFSPHPVPLRLTSFFPCTHRIFPCEIFLRALPAGGRLDTCWPPPLFLPFSNAHTNLSGLPLSGTAQWHLFFALRRVPKNHAFLFSGEFLTTPPLFRPQKRIFAWTSSFFSPPSFIVHSSMFCLGSLSPTRVPQISRKFLYSP